MKSTHFNLVDKPEHDTSGELVVEGVFSFFWLRRFPFQNSHLQHATTTQEEEHTPQDTAGHLLHYDQQRRTEYICVASKSCVLSRYFYARCRESKSVTSIVVYPFLYSRSPWTVVEAAEYTKHQQHNQD